MFRYFNNGYFFLGICIESNNSKSSFPFFMGFPDDIKLSPITEHSKSCHLESTATIIIHVCCLVLSSLTISDQSNEFSLLC